MPRRKTEYIEKIVNLHIHKSSLKSSAQKHQLIVTLNHLLKVSPDDISSKLNNVFTSGDMNIRMPARSSHSSYLKKNSVKSAINALENSSDIHITVTHNDIVEKYQNNAFQKSKDNIQDDDVNEKDRIAEIMESSYLSVQVAFIIKRTTFKAWYELNKGFINEMNNLLNDDKKVEVRCHELLLSVVQDLAPKSEQHLIKPTRIWFRKNINREPITTQPKNKPFRVSLMAITGKNQDEDNTPSLHFFIKPYDYIGYIPCKLEIKKASDFEANILSDTKSKFTITVTKKELTCTVNIKFSNGHGDTALYSLALEQEVKDIPRNPFTKKETFKHQYMWDHKLPDKEYVIVKNASLARSTVELVANRGEIDKRSIEYTMAQFHNLLSVFKWEGRTSLLIPEANVEEDIPYYKFNDEIINM